MAWIHQAMLARLIKLSVEAPGKIEEATKLDIGIYSAALSLPRAISLACKPKKASINTAIIPRMKKESRVRAYMYLGGKNKRRPAAVSTANKARRDTISKIRAIA